jgi:hypothetical protein
MEGRREELAGWKEDLAGWREELYNTIEGRTGRMRGGQGRMEKGAVSIEEELAGLREALCMAGWRKNWQEKRRNWLELQVSYPFPPLLLLIPILPTSSFVPSSAKLPPSISPNFLPVSSPLPPTVSLPTSLCILPITFTPLTYFPTFPPYFFLCPLLCQTSSQYPTNFLSSSSKLPPVIQVDSGGISRSTDETGKRRRGQVYRKSAGMRRRRRRGEKN